jgi:hypothetical protein
MDNTASGSPFTVEKPSLFPAFGDRTIASVRTLPICGCPDKPPSLPARAAVWLQVFV